MADKTTSQPTPISLPHEERVWDDLSPEWEKWIGDNGDWNRKESSDGIIWKWIDVAIGGKKLRDDFVGISSEGSTEQLTVLDAGCGTGYLCVKLAQKGFTVFGVDISTNQLSFAKQRVEKFHLESRISLLKESLDNMISIKDSSIDVVISNYVLMDLQNYISALKEIHRVLKQGGSAILVFSHPCFNPPQINVLNDGSKILTWPSIHHENNYFKESSFTYLWEEKFAKPFLVYHRPLSSYWKAFKEMNFEIVDFEEPGIGQYSIPCGLAFFLRKKNV